VNSSAQAPSLLRYDFQYRCNGESIGQFGCESDRVSQTVNGVTTNYVLDSASPLTQVLQDGTNTYIYGTDRIAQINGSVPEYFLTDGLGSVRQLVDSAGNITLAKSYQPYGMEASSLGGGYSSYGFTGEMTDSTGLIYLRARYLGPSDGRFLTKDLWMGDYNRPLSLTRWMYAYGNPVKDTDPSGHCPRPKDESDSCWQLLLQIESQYNFIDLQSELSEKNYWTYEELLNMQEDLERYDRAANIGLSTLYPEDVKIKRVRKDTYFGQVICGGSSTWFTNGRSIQIFNAWAKGCLIHELGHYLDDANLHLAKPFEKYVGASTGWFWSYDVGDEFPPFYDPNRNQGNPPNRHEDFAESLSEYVLLYTNYSDSNIRIVPGEKRWYFIESILDTGQIPITAKSSECIPGLGVLAQLGSY